MTWVAWLVLAVALAVGEVLTTSFFLAPFAGGALVAAAGAAAGLSFVPAGLLFVAVSGLLFVFVRPIARRHLVVPPALRSGTAALVGRTATVLERVDGAGGLVRLEGETWSARPYDEDAVIEPGRRVHVLEIRGATALVSE